MLKWDLFHRRKNRICWIIINQQKKTSILIFVLHIGTNDLTLSDIPEQIAEHIFDKVSSLKTDSNSAIVSNIVPRGDKNKEKAETAIQITNNAYVQRNISVIYHICINSKRHLNRNKLHSNSYRKSIFIRNFKNFSKDFDWQSEVHGEHFSKSSLSSTDSVSDSLSDLVSIKVQILLNFKNLVIWHLNINSIRKKFEKMADIIINFSIFLISESIRIHLFQTRNSKWAAAKYLDMIGTGTLDVFFQM